MAPRQEQNDPEELDNNNLLPSFGSHMRPDGRTLTLWILLEDEYPSARERNWWPLIVKGTEVESGALPTRRAIVAVRKTRKLTASELWEFLDKQDHFADEWMKAVHAWARDRIRPDTEGTCGFEELVAKAPDPADPGWFYLFSRSGSSVFGHFGQSFYARRDESNPCGWDLQIQSDDGSVQWSRTKHEGSKETLAMAVFAKYGFLEEDPDGEAAEHASDQEWFEPPEENGDGKEESDEVDK